MYLVAQRVHSLQGHEGINAFYYSHGPIAWLDKPPPDLHAGKLMNAQISVKPPGNRVRSFLDIVSPDVTPSRHVWTAITDSIDLFENKNLPLRVQSGDVTFGFDVEQALAPSWRQELVYLLHHALAVRV